MRRLEAVAIAALLVLGSGVARAQLPGQAVLVGVYTDVPSPIGLAYDSTNDLIWYTTQADCFVHSLVPFKDFTPVQRASFAPTSNGVPEVSAGLAQNSAFVTDPVAAGGACASNQGLAYDESIKQLAHRTSQSSVLQSFDPITAANLNPNYRPGSDPIGNPVDGLDVDGADIWLSYDVADTYENGVLFSDRTNTAHTTLPYWSGTGGPVAQGWSGVERVCDSLYAVAVQGPDSTTSRTIVRFDAYNGALIGFDPDGFGVGQHLEDLAYDGQYFYVADVFGDANGSGVQGDVYVFEVSGGLKDDGCADDHLKCYKVKDPLQLSGIVDLDSPQFGLEPHCKISKPKLFCVPVKKTVISAKDQNGPISLLPIGDRTPLTNADRICYAIKCPVTHLPVTPVGDQFGTRTVGKFTAKLLCAPARKMCRFTGIHMCGGGCPDPADQCIVAPDDSACICVPRPTPTPAPTATPSPEATTTPTPVATPCPLQCIAGPNNGLLCHTPSDCPGGACAVPTCCCALTGFPPCAVTADCQPGDVCGCP